MLQEALKNSQFSFVQTTIYVIPSRNPTHSYHTPAYLSPKEVTFLNFITIFLTILFKDVYVILGSPCHIFLLLLLIRNAHIQLKNE